MPRKAWHLNTCATSILALALIMPVAAYAQSEAAEDTPSAAPDAAASADTVAVEELVVTGTRLSNSGFDAPTPVSVISGEEIARAAPSTVADYVNQLPALSGSNTPRTTRGNLGDALGGGNFLNLRNLGNTRTLVLLNGRRVTPSTITGITDINVLPSSLIERVDVVTGGASAAWGSDAVAGVVNFVLDKDYTGIKGKVQGGTSIEGDAGNLSLELSLGTPFAGGRGHLLLSGQYEETGAAYFASRDWFKAYKIVPNPAASQAGQPARLILPWTSVAATNNGLVTSGPLKGLFFNDAGGIGGTNFPFEDILSTIYLGGDRDVYSRLADQSRNAQSSTPLERGSAFGRVSFELTDGITAFAEGSFAKSHSITPIANYFRFGNANLSIDNFYATPEVRQLMANAGVTSLPVSIAYPKIGLLQSEITRRSLRGLGGLEGEFSGGWKWDVSYQYGETKAKIRSPENPIVPNYNRAIDVVEDPNNPGQPICRSTLTDSGNGCVPINPVGSAPLNASQLAYVRGNSMQDLTYRQTVIAANLSGSLFDLPAGPLSFAAGAEYRTEKAVATVDALSQSAAYFAGNYKAFNGKYNVKEVYAEIGVPVLQDSAVGRSLDLNFAGRLTDYSTSGSVVTWKAGFRYEPIDGIEVRATRSRDIRAPNLQELFLAGELRTSNVIDPFNGNMNANFLQTTRGNPGLDPEKADTLTAGVIFRPAFLPGASLSVDYYDIKIDDAIAVNSSQFIVNRCFAGDDQFCSAITRNSDNVITGINLQPFNALSERARGVDIELSYRTDLGAGDLTLRGLANYVDKLEIISPLSTIDRAGEVGNNVGAAEGVPTWRALASATYELNNTTFQIKGRFIGASKIERDWGPADVNINSVPAIAYLDLYLGQKVSGFGGAEGEFFVAADNVLNQDPPIVATQDNSNLLGSGTNVFIYDTIGTTVRAGFRFNF